jgi:hypothetical protein
LTALPESRNVQQIGLIVAEAVVCSPIVFIGSVSSTFSVFSDGGNPR